MRKKSIILFLKASSGELHVALPILFLFKIKYPDVNIYFASKEKNILEKLRVSKTLNETISEIGNCYFGKSKLKQLLKEILFNSSETIILTCDNGPGNYERFLYALKLNSSFCFYHHAYALHSYDEKVVNEYKQRYKNFRNRYPKDSYVFINSEFDYKWYNKVLGFKKNNISVIGALGYSSEWFKHLGIKSKKDIKSVSKIFVPIRHAHKLYLTKQNYEYQLETVFEVAEKFPNIEFVIKPHPRQSDIIEIVQCANNYNNIEVSNESTLILSHNSDITISFWSSAILDSIAVGTPAVEFHKHKTYHPQLINEENYLKSIYSDLDLAISITSKKEIIDLIERLDREKLNCLYQKQRTKFLDVFKINSEVCDNIDVLKSIFNETNKINLLKYIQKVLLALTIISRAVGKKIRNTLFLKHVK